ncbi:hypothetical protein PR003_g34661 [Phytophthora rubi]|uniref:Uncharacterized protein n=2 Tax=Phytophthora rubi TaxID=129364 RepID=A0A6A3G4W7_9STRA|nr:hypothetical protein PR002_g32887 [Phytophthora rubi]KAE8951742.1 hypothetical protein PR001_g33598 [Phytophthora rubi]KAE9259730.1 hypothetical protein PR003_g34661 [Phytophthora rubi]
MEPLDLLAELFEAAMKGFGTDEKALRAAVVRYHLVLRDRCASPAARASRSAPASRTTGSPFASTRRQLVVEPPTGRGGTAGVCRSPPPVSPMPVDCSTTNRLHHR